MSILPCIRTRFFYCLKLNKGKVNFMKKILTILLALCLVISVFSGCSKTNDPTSGQSTDQITDSQENANNNGKEDNKNKDSVTFIDGLGEQVTVNKKPQNVICLYNSYLDLWYEAGGTVIGTIESREKAPEGAENAEIVGTMTSPNMEKILSMQPDLVILRPGMKGQGDIIPLLKQNKIPYLAIEYDNFEQYIETMRVFTELNERPDLFEEKAVAVKEKVDDIIANVPKDEKPTVLLMFATAKGVTVKLPNSFVGDMIQDLGAENIAYDAKLTDEEMEIFSMEKVVERDPDFILVQTMGDIDEIKDRLVKDVESNPAWGSLRAVKEGRYLYLPKELYLYKPNALYGEAYEGLAKMLYPETFK